MGNQNKIINNKEVGNTPIIYYNNLYYKLEFFNPTGSIKDRATYNILKNYLDKEIIKPNDTIIEATSGNMGISLAYFGKLFKLKVVIVMPDSASIERIKLLERYGAQIILTDGSLGMTGALEKQNQLVKEFNYLPIKQFENIYNTLAHLKTGEEIIKELPDVDYIICGIGSGGTISGLSKYFKSKSKEVKLIGIEPFESPIINKGIKGQHKIQGIGAGFIPPLLDLKDIHTIELVKSEEVIEKFKQDNPLNLGLSGIACEIIGHKLFKKEPKAKILIIVADGIDRYESMIR